jgi:hypothetical protein
LHHARRCAPVEPERTESPSARIKRADSHVPPLCRDHAELDGTVWNAVGPEGDADLRDFQGNAGQVRVTRGFLEDLVEGFDSLLRHLDLAGS